MQRLQYCEKLAAQGRAQSAGTLEATAIDWHRDSSGIFLNGRNVARERISNNLVPAFDQYYRDRNRFVQDLDTSSFEPPHITAADVDALVETNFSTTLPEIRGAIKTGANQSGFMRNAGRSVSYLSMEITGAITPVLIIGNSRVDIMSNSDGSATVIEAIPVIGYKNSKNPQTKNYLRENLEPVAIVVTLSKLVPDANEPTHVRQHYISDNTYVFDKPASDIIFSNIDKTHFHYHAKSTQDEFDAEYERFVNEHVNQEKHKPGIFKLADIKNVQAINAPVREAVELEDMQRQPQRPSSARLTDAQFIARTTLFAGLTGAALVAIAVTAAIIIGTAIPTFGLSLFVTIPVLIVGGLFAGAAIGLASSSLGCAAANVFRPHRRVNAIEVGSDDKVELKHTIQRKLSQQRGEEIRNTTTLKKTVDQSLSVNPRPDTSAGLVTPSESREPTSSPKP